MRSTCFALPLLVLAVSVPAAAQTRPGTPVVTTDLAASPEEVFQGLQEVLQDWKMRKASLEERVVKTEWVVREQGRETFRGRIVAEFEPNGYVTRLAVRHEVQRRMTELSPTVGGRSATWADWDGDWAVAQAIVRSLEEAFGHQPGAIPVSQLGAERREDEPFAEIHRPVECIVPPDVAARINELKARRRDLVREVKAMDQRIVAAFHEGRPEPVLAEMDEIRARKATMEGQVVEIDREILALVVAD